MPMARANTLNLETLESYLGGKWSSGGGEGTRLLNPSTGEAIAWCSSEGNDLESALEYSRTTGRDGLHPLSFAARADLLGKIAECLAADRERWIEIARANSGNTNADASIDIDGAIGTLKYFAKLGSKAGDARLLVDGGATRLARDPNFQAIHLGVPLDGVAVHINAFNFPAWGLWEKAAVSLLAGVPVVSKPATSTAWLAVEMVRKVVDAGILPSGSLSVLCGPAGDLLSHLRFGDAVAFTGSAATASDIRRHPAIEKRGVRLNVEADSLNAALLGPDVEAGSPAFALFVREVVKEMTVKAGQKCTAIRRIIVPASVRAQVADAVSAALAKVVVGNPANPSVTMGPLVHPSQRRTVEEGIRALQSGADVVYRQTPLSLVDADESKGAFVGPVLFQASQSCDAVHELEVFGPVATVISYAAAANAFALARRGGGSLAASVFSADTAFLAKAAVELGPSHGRLLLVDPSIGDSHTGHGIVMPSCIHGGPGRAGGGEELGGLRGIWFYHQKVAIQASASTLAGIASQAFNTTTE